MGTSSPTALPLGEDLEYIVHDQNVLQSVVDWFYYVFAHNQFAYIEEHI